MDLDSGEKSRFLKEFGHRVEGLIYQKFKSKDAFIGATGFYKKSLHDILTGERDTHISTVYRLAKALKVPMKKLFEDLEK